MTMRLETECPAGQYLVAPTLVLMRFSPQRKGGYGRDNGNRLLIELGLSASPDEFAAVGSKEYMNLFGSGYSDHGEFEFEE